MVKPRMILLIRHAQSEGNKNREIHQLIPDHRVKLTDEGRTQAEDAGRRLRALLRPDDTLQFFTSPYRRTRETTEGILRTLTSSDESGEASPFSRHSIKVYEEPRLREQDFGNFQPCSAEMQRMWKERADYGHFFYRIPNGESAADAYDRISGFNESLWRQFSEPDFPSVCILVTHGLMTRTFLMKWYHWSVEYFEDLRNINHCEFIVMKKNPENDKYDLQNKLRTWSELKRQKLEQAASEGKADSTPPPQDLLPRNTISQFLSNKSDIRFVTSPITAQPPTKWGGCIDGCKHDDKDYPRRDIQNRDHVLPPPASSQTTSSNSDGAADPNTVRPRTPLKSVPAYLLSGRDAGGTSTPPTPEPVQEERDAYFNTGGHNNARSTKLIPQRKATQEDLARWADESGMGKGVRADALGDEPDEHDELEERVDADVDNEKAYETSVGQSVY